MTNPATTQNAGEAINKKLFAVLGMVPEYLQSRTVAFHIILKTINVISVQAWKIRPISSNLSRSLTIPKHI